MRKLLLVAVVLAAFAAAPSGQAITYGTPTGSAYPYVGALVTSDGPYCSGTLISSTVFLTAAHCEEGSRVCVTFDPQWTPRSKVYCGTWYAHPDSSVDVAVVVFDKPIRGIEPAQVVSLGLLDQMKAEGTLTQKTAFTSVGYGAQEDDPPHGWGLPGSTFTYLDRREYSVGYFNALNDNWLRISQNIHTGSGGTCYGDSGGPQFLGDTNIVVSITVTGDMFCKSTNVSQRLDIASVQDFLSQYVEL